MAKAGAIRAGRAYVEVGEDHSKLARGLRKAQAQLKAFAAGVQALGRKMIVASAAMLTPLVAATVVFARFEQSMARVKALTGATGESFKRLEDEAKRLGAITIFTASQAAEAMGYFALAGYNVEKILKAIGPTLLLATVGQLEIAESADIVAKVMAGMGLEADQVGRAVDVLTKAMTTANTDLIELGGAMKFIGPIAKAARMEFEEVVAAVQMLSNAGLEGQMAGTILRGALLKLTAPSVEAEQLLRELGVSASDAAGNVRSLADIIEDLQRAMAGKGTGEQLGILGTIFGARPAAGMAELLSQGGDKLREFTQALREAGGTAARKEAVMLNTLTGDVRTFKSAVESAAIAVGESFRGLARLATRAVTKAVGALKTWVEGNRDLVVMVGAAIVATGAFGVALMGLGIGVHVAAFALGGLLTVLTAVKVALGLLLSLNALVVVAVAVAGAEILAWTGASASALAWLGDKFGRLRGFVGKVLAGIRSAMVAGNISLAADVLWAGLRVAWETGALELMKVWNTLESAWVAVVTKMWRLWVNFQSDLGKTGAIAAHYAAEAWIDQQERMGVLSRHQAKRRREELDVEFSEEAAGRAPALYEALSKLEAGKGHAAASEAAIARAERALKAAQAALDASLKEAGATTPFDWGKPGRDWKKDWDAAMNALEGVGGKVAMRVQAVGTFNPLAARGLTGKLAADRTAKATEGTEKEVRRLREYAENNPLVFLP